MCVHWVKAAEDTICRMEDRLEEEERRLQVHYTIYKRNIHSKTYNNIQYKAELRSRSRWTRNYVEDTEPEPKLSV